MQERMQIAEELMSGLAEWNGPYTQSFDSAVDYMKQLRRDGKEPEIFVDRGWGNAPLQISIIVDGNGQHPLAIITEETYRRMLAEKVIGGNCLRTMKARKLHPFILST